VKRRSQGRRWSIRAYLVLLVAIVIAAGGAAAWYSKSQTDADGKRVAAADASFGARVAARELARYIAVVKSSTGNLAANPQIARVLAKPAGCTLTFAGLAGKDQSRLDIVRADGKIVCSSVPSVVGARLRAAAWARRAVTTPIFDAPVVDPATGTQVALNSAPIPGGKGFVAAFVDLGSLGLTLHELYGGAHDDSFVVTSSDGKTVVTRSIAPTRWIGRPLAGTAFAEADGQTVRPDLDGTKRI
jgi:uncharacterized protein (UPF0333 family)